MNMLDSITGEMWIDLLGLTDPTRRLGAGRVHIVSVITLLEVVHNRFGQKSYIVVCNGFRS